MGGIKWGIMNGGTLDLDKSVLTFMRDMGKLITIPIWQGYIETPEHKIVCDTSFDIENKDWRVKLAGEKYQPGIEFWGEKQSSEQRIENQLKKIGLTPDDIDEMVLRQSLQTNGSGDPDLIIRTGGERRLSNFLPYQTVYSELIFMDVFWPEMKKKDFSKAINDFEARQRRFGK